MDETSCRDALLGAIRDDPDYAAGTSKALVFAGETGSADQISGLLHEAGVAHVVYHKNRPAGERAAALELMAAPPAAKNSESKVGWRDARIVLRYLPQRPRPGNPGRVETLTMCIHWVVIRHNLPVVLC